METGEIVIYQAQDGQTSIDVRLEKETVWITLNQLSALFNRDKSVISRHISNIFKESELDVNSVVAKNATTGSDGKTYQVEYFNLDVIISVGYRVKSPQGTQFRIWANTVLKEYLVKGYAVNEKRLKEQSQQLEQLKQTVKLLGNVLENQSNVIVQQVVAQFKPSPFYSNYLKRAVWVQYKRNALVLSVISASFYQVAESFLR